MRRREFLQLLAGAPLAGVDAGLLAAEAVRFAPVVPGKTLTFPRDHGAHPDFRMEWWYATGWLSLPDGSPLGFQSTFFRVRTGIGEDNPSAFAPSQVVLAHAAIADPLLGRLRHDQRSARVAFGRAGFSAERTDVWVDDWRFRQDVGGYRTEVRASGFGYALSLSAGNDVPMLNGREGFFAKAADVRHASYYYSRPQLQVQGSVTLDGRERFVTGHAWLDHEWSSELLPDAAQGWDWVGLNLADGGALMAFRLRRPDGGALWSAGTFRPPGGKERVFDSHEIAFEPMREWRSSRTGITYPVEWRLRFGARVVHLRPLIDDQELDSRPSTGAVYWEGAVRVFEDGREIGRGYLEMTGYGERMSLG